MHVDYLGMTALEGGAGYDAALFLGPGGPVTVGGTGVTDELGVRAAG